MHKWKKFRIFSSPVILFEFSCDILKENCDFFKNLAKLLGYRRKHTEHHSSGKMIKWKKKEFCFSFPRDYTYTSVSPENFRILWCQSAGKRNKGYGVTLKSSQKWWLSKSCLPGAPMFLNETSFHWKFWKRSIPMTPGGPGVSLGYIFLFC